MFIVLTFQVSSKRPERAEAPSPGQHPGVYHSRKPVALKGQKL